MPGPNTKQRADELLAAAMRLVTPEVRDKLDYLHDPALVDRILAAEAAGDEDTANELKRDPIYQTRRAGQRILETLLREQMGCSHPTARQYIAKALRLRRGEAVEASKRGGYRPGAGAPVGNNNRGKVAAAMSRADDLTDGGHDDPTA